MKDIYVFSYSGLDDNAEVYASNQMTRVLEEDLDVFAVAGVFADFLRGCGFLESTINKVLKLD
jgi:hypothetical protein